MKMANCGKLEGRPEKIFFVNTKSNCFLCLEEFSPSVSSTQSLGNERTRSTGGRGTGKGEATGSQVKFHLRKIFQYLQLDTSKVFDGVSVGSPLLRLAGEPLDKMTDFSVVLCENCSTVATKLNALCEQLELLQAKVEHALRKFQGKLLHCSDRNPLVQVNEVRNQLISPLGLEMVHAMVADILREKTKEKCSLRLKIALPRVKALESSKERHLSNNETPPSIKTEPPEFMDPTSEDDAIETNPELSEADMLQIISFKLPTMAEIPQLRDSNNFVTCSLCPVSANSVFSKELLFQRHVTCCHLDFLFASLKQPRLSMEQFKDYCEHLLELEIKSSEQGDINKKKNSDQTPGFICHVCGDVFHEVKVILGHLVLAHSDTLAQKLVHLQKDTSVTPEQLSDRTRSDLFTIEGPKFKCEDCGRVFAAPSSLYRHKRVPCRQRSALGDRAVNRPFICAHCGLSFTSAYGRKIHTKRIHLGINHNRDRTTCELCGKTMSVSSIGRHKNVSCPVRLGKTGKAQPTQSPSSSSSNSSYHQQSTEVQQDFPYYLNENLKIEVVEEEEEEREAPIFYNIGNERRSRVIVRNPQRSFARIMDGDDDEGGAFIEHVDDSSYDDNASGTYNEGRYEDVEMILVEPPTNEDPLQIRYEQNNFR